MCDSRKRESICEGSKKKWSARKISRCARNDGMGGMGLFHVAYNEYVWKALFLYRHPERSRGIFLAYRYGVLCETAENGNASAKGARKSRVKGRFPAAPLMTVGGMGLFHVAYNEYVWKALFLYRHPERSRGIFLAYRYGVLCETAENGNASAKGARKSRVKGRFPAAPLMTVWGNGFISRSIQRICLESTIPVSSSRPKWRDLSGTLV